MSQVTEPPKTDLECEERMRLEQGHERAGAALESARALVRSRIGVSPLEEFQSVDRAADEAWAVLQRANLRLDRHIWEHGCKRDGMRAQ
jgi:hypothetical protein